ncbi:MFS transporter [Rubrivirga sp. IMCC45206]|uniref:MFS transporter n=1 Tax=Rubrivirga sp. IMCC45206 TaxID=3391614 RepID=UPI00398FAE75
MTRRPLALALTERRRLRFTTLVALYVGQGIPQGLLVVALPAYLAERGASAAEVGGYVGLVLLPFALKALVAPLLDRFTYAPMGRRRPWVLAAGAGVAGAFVGLSLAPEALAVLTAWGVAVNAAVAVLDAAVDGMAVDVLEVEEQPRANALMWGGATAGVAVSAVVTARLLDAGGVSLAAGVVAAVLAALLAIPAVVRERPGERLLPWTAGGATGAASSRPGGWRPLVRALWAAATRPASLWLLGVAAAAGALDGLVIAFMPVLAVGELGWSDTGYADLVALGQVAAGLIGMAVGSVLIGRVGRVRMLVAMGVGLVAVLAAMASASAWWGAAPTLIAFALSYLIAFVLLTITVLATGMALCGPAIAATQFALFTTAMNLGRSSGSGLLNVLDGGLGPSGILAAAAALAAVVAALASRIDVDAHRRWLARTTAVAGPLTGPADVH